jgi:hypothetical protein
MKHELPDKIAFSYDLAEGFVLQGIKRVRV